MRFYSQKQIIRNWQLPTNSFNLKKYIDILQGIQNSLTAKGQDKHNFKNVSHYQFCLLMFIVASPNRLIMPEGISNKCHYKKIRVDNSIMLCKREQYCSFEDMCGCRTKIASDFKSDFMGIIEHLFSNALFFLRTCMERS